MKISEKLRSIFKGPTNLMLEGEIEDEEAEVEDVVNHGYVVVNLTQKAFLADGCIVMPREEPCTYMTLNEALGLVARLHEEDERHKYGETIRVYRLAPVPEGEIRSLFDLLKEIKET